MKLIGFVLLVLSIIKLITIGLFCRSEQFSDDYSTFFGHDVDTVKVVKWLILYSAVEGTLGMVCGLYVSAF